MKRSQILVALSVIGVTAGYFFAFPFNLVLALLTPSIAYLAMVSFGHHGLNAIPGSIVMFTAQLITIGVLNSWLLP